MQTKGELVIECEEGGSGEVGDISWSNPQPWRATVSATGRCLGYMVKESLPAGSSFSRS